MTKDTHRHRVQRPDPSAQAVLEADELSAEAAPDGQVTLRGTVHSSPRNAARAPKN
ncbi:MAG TPA: hypothetical protein VF060_23095 [Trebonia sp.]